MFLVKNTNLPNIGMNLRRKIYSKSNEVLQKENNFPLNLQKLKNNMLLRTSREEIKKKNKAAALKRKSKLYPATTLTKYK